MTSHPATGLLKQPQHTWHARWFWYSVICVFCWGAWALLSKQGSREIPPNAMQFLFTVGTVPVGLVLLIARRGRLEKSPRGISYGLLNGILSGLGGLALFAAYQTNGSTTLITATTALYPMITVVLAIAILRERFRPIQAVGLLFAALKSGGKASVVAPFTALYPLVVILLVPWVLHESVSLLQWAGVACALIAVVLLSE
jgi:transporter family protein